MPVVHDRRFLILGLFEYFDHSGHGTRLLGQFGFLALNRGGQFQEQCGAVTTISAPVLTVCVVERVKDLARIFERFVYPEKPLETLALGKFQHQVIRADVVELADVGMVQCRNGAGFALEALGEFALGDRQF